MANFKSFELSLELKEFIKNFRLSLRDFKRTGIECWEKEFYLSESKKYNIKQAEMLNLFNYLNEK